MSKNTNIGVNVGSGWEAGGYVDASKCDPSKMGIEISMHSPCNSPENFIPYGKITENGIECTCAVD